MDNFIRCLRGSTAIRLGAYAEAGRGFRMAPKPKPERSEAELRWIAENGRCPDERRGAAAELASRIGRISDIRSLGIVLRMSDDQDARRTAFDRLCSGIGQVSETKVLEAMLMNATEPELINKLATALSSRIGEVTNPICLIHIALNSSVREARFLSVRKLAENPGSLIVIAAHSAFGDTRALARGLLPIPHEKP